MKSFTISTSTEIRRRLLVLLPLTLPSGMCFAESTPLLDVASNIAKDLDADGKRSEAEEIVRSTPLGKSTYVFFVSTSEAYSKQGVDDVVKALRERFSAFGRDIGDGSVAMWINEKGSRRLSARFGKFIVDRYHLLAAAQFDYSKGPYLIVTNVHPAKAFDEDFQLLNPEDSNLASPFVAGISLNGVAPVYVVDVLNALEQGIRRKNLTGSNLTKVEVWLTFKTWLDSNREEVGKALKDVLVAVLGTLKKA